nr:MAG TPA: hypothetical protein [Caudoviricetes sp.]
MVVNAEGMQKELGIVFPGARRALGASLEGVW